MSDSKIATVQVSNDPQTWECQEDGRTIGRIVHEPPLYIATAYGGSSVAVVEFDAAVEAIRKLAGKPD